MNSDFFEKSTEKNEVDIFEQEKNMFEKYGEFGSCGEINAKAEQLFNSGDAQGIRDLAAENGLPSELAEAYLEGDIPELCDALTAAAGKLDIEEQDIVMVGVMEDWLGYIQAQCLENSERAIAVRSKKKSLKGCLAELLLWSLLNQKKVDKEILGSVEKAVKTQKIDLKKQAGIEPRWLQHTRIGIMNMRTAKQLILRYYLGEAR